MPFGKEAQEELVKLVQGKRLKVYAFGDDRYGRCVGDIYCNGVYVQVRLEEESYQIAEPTISTLSLTRSPVHSTGADAEAGACMALRRLRQTSGACKG